MGSAIEYDTSALAHDEGYHKGLKPRHLQMIAIGGPIGTGLFMEPAAGLHTAGPGLFIVYAVCGLFVFFILRALGELVLHRPSSGSFVSYAREFLGEKAAYVAGWMYFFNWACTSIVDVTAVALYMHWGVFKAVPQWTIALIAPGDRADRQHDLGEIVWRDGVLGRPDQGRRTGDISCRRDRVPRGPVYVEGQSTGFSVIADNGGHPADRCAAAGVPSSPKHR